MQSSFYHQVMRIVFCLSIVFTGCGGGGGSGDSGGGGGGCLISTAAAESGASKDVLLIVLVLGAVLIGVSKLTIRSQK